ncbi:MAG: response regulator transcription factor [Trueperaceae bacterium]
MPIATLATKPLVVSVDDEATILKLVEHILGAHYTVMTFVDTEQALQSLRGLRPDIILCDINMPRMDGFEFHHLLRARELLCSVPFIYLTALGDRGTFRKGMLQGADDYLVKPFTANELKAAVEARLERTQDLREREAEEIWFITSLGGVVVEADGKVRDFHEQKKGLELFLYLRSKDHPTPYADILRDLWREPVELNTLHVLLNRARKTFAGLAEFAVKEDTVVVRLLRPYVWDAALFEQAARQASDEVSIEKALQFSKGSFLTGFSSPWSEEQRDYYEGLYVALLELSVELASNDTQRTVTEQRLKTYLGLEKES